MPGVTSPTVWLGGRGPTLGGFSKARSRVDLTTAVITTLGPLADSSQSLQWSGWRGYPVEGFAIESPDVGVVFAGPDEGSASTSLSAVLSELAAEGADVYVLPAEPDMRLIDLVGIRRSVVQKRAEFVELGSMASGRAFEDALERVARRARQKAARVSRGNPGPASPAADVGAQSSEVVESDMARSRPSPPPGLREGEPVVMMPPPPALRDFPIRRPVARDPSLKKVPALAK